MKEKEFISCVGGSKAYVGDKVHIVRPESVETYDGTVLEIHEDIVTIGQESDSVTIYIGEDVPCMVYLVGKRSSDKPEENDKPSKNNTKDINWVKYYEQEVEVTTLNGVVFSGLLYDVIVNITGTYFVIKENDMSTITMDADKIRSIELVETERKYPYDSCKMSSDRFKELLDELDGNSLQTLKEKNARYSQNGDCLHNFRSGAEIVDGTPAQACWGYLTKHLVALRDMVDRDDFSNREDFLEKCQDTINYIRFLWCIGNDEKPVIPEEGPILEVRVYKRIRNLLYRIHRIYKDDPGLKVYKNGNLTCVRHETKLGTQVDAYQSDDYYVEIIKEKESK